MWVKRKCKYCRELTYHNLTFSQHTSCILCLSVCHKCKTEKVWDVELKKPKVYVKGVHYE